MAVRRLSPEQPVGFSFSSENLVWADMQIAKYPPGRQASAVIPLLWRAQEQEGWVSEPAIRVVAEMLDMPYIRVLEVATFYTMFHLAPVGRKAHVQVCGTTPCMLRGAGDIVDACRRRISAHPHEVSPDGDFSWEEVECLGACVNAPMVQIFSDTYEDLTVDAFEAMLDAFARGEAPTPGPQVERVSSAPEGGLTTLRDVDAREARARSKGKPVAGESGHASPRTSKARSENAAKPNPEEGPEEEAARTPAGSRAKRAPDEAQREASEAAASSAPRAPGPATGARSKGKPRALKQARRGGPDDLKRISGVGPKLEATLNELGVYHYDQIAGWTPENVSWIDEHLKFRGRIDREDWIAQAKALAETRGKGST